MAIANGQVLLLRALKEAGVWGSLKTICELGSQVPITEELADLFKFFETIPLEQGYSAKELYRYLGILHYTSIDFNGLLNALPFDLNRNLRTDYNYHETFDLVTNYGTANVVFNQFEVFRNIHNLCSSDGYMIHTFPSQGWGNQWFYRYDSRLIEDLATANNYQILFLEPFLRFKPYLRKNSTDAIGQVRVLCDFVEWIVDNAKPPENSGNSVDSDLVAQREIENRSDIKQALTSIGKEDALFNITLACILKKNNTNEFVTPTLNIYQ